MCKFRGGCGLFLKYQGKRVLSQITSENSHSIDWNGLLTCFMQYGSRTDSLIRYIGRSAVSLSLDSVGYVDKGSLVVVYT